MIDTDALRPLCSADAQYAALVRDTWPEATDDDVREVVKWARDDAMRYSDGKSCEPSYGLIHKNAMHERDRTRL